MSTTPDSDTGTVCLHRVLRAPPSRVYRAFLDPAAMCKWFPPHGFTASVQHLDAREGGGYHMAFTNFGTGMTHGFSGTYVELVPDTLLRSTDKFDHPAMPGEMQVTVRLTPCALGTELEIVQAGLPAVIAVTDCVRGWQDSLNQLAALVEPEIPDA